MRNRVKKTRIVSVCLAINQTGCLIALFERLLPTVERCNLTRDLFASEFVIRAERDGKRVQEIPIHIVEKRPPSINLFKRVPKVLRDIARLTYIIRVKG